MTHSPSGLPTGPLAAEIRNRLGSPPKLPKWPFVSIVVPNRNGAEHLRHLLAGLSVSTDYPALELIVVDNGSTDESLAVLRSTDTPFSLSVIANADNESFSNACNRGAELASGQLLLFLNNDVEPFEPAWLRELVASLLTSGAGAVAATLLCDESEHKKSFSHGYGVQHRGLAFTQEDGRAAPDLRGWEDDPLDEKLGMDIECEAIAAACLLIPSEIYTQVGGFSPGYFYGCEDVDLSLKLRAANLQVLCSGRALALHHPASTRRRMPSEEARETKLANRRLLWERWGPDLSPT